MSPTAGGVYHWVSDFAPRKWQRCLSYSCGWMSCIAWQAITAVDCYIIGDTLQSLIAANNPTYTSTRWTTALLTILTVILVSAFNMLAASHLSFLEGIFATCHVFAFVPVVVTLWVMVTPKTSPSEVFAHFRDYTGSWPSSGLSLLVGQATCIFVTIGSDSAAHLAEEIEGAAAVVPQTMVWSYLLNIPLTFIMLLTYCFNIGSVGNAVKSGQPFIYIFQHALGSSGAVTAFMLIIVVLLTMVTISTMASTSRQTFAFARDNGLPLAHWISRVSPRFHVPFNAIFLGAGVTTTLILLNLGSSATLDTLMSLSNVALMATYILSVGCVALRRYREQPLPKARWSLGKAGLSVNCIAISYTIWCCFWSLWPSEFHPTAANFNWAVLLFVGIMGLAGVLFVHSAKQRYHGPVLKVHHWMNEW